MFQIARTFPSGPKKKAATEHTEFTENFEYKLTAFGGTFFRHGFTQIYTDFSTLLL